MNNAGPRRSAARERRARAAGVELARAAERDDEVLAARDAHGVEQAEHEHARAERVEARVAQRVLARRRRRRALLLARGRRAPRARGWRRCRASW